MKTISRHLYQGTQSWNFTWVITHKGTKYRVELERDSHDFQSHAKVYRWDGNAWQFIYSEPLAVCAFKAVSYVDRTPDEKLFESDAIRLLDKAIEIGG